MEYKSVSDLKSIISDIGPDTIPNISACILHVNQLQMVTVNKVPFLMNKMQSNEKVPNKKPHALIFQD